MKLDTAGLLKGQKTASVPRDIHVEVSQTPGCEPGEGSVPHKKCKRILKKSK